MLTGFDSENISSSVYTIVYNYNVYIRSDYCVDRWPQGVDHVAGHENSNPRLVTQSHQTLFLPSSFFLHRTMAHTLDNLFYCAATRRSNPGPRPADYAMYIWRTTFVSLLFLQQQILNYTIILVSQKRGIIVHRGKCRQMSKLAFLGSLLAGRRVGISVCHGRR